MRKDKEVLRKNDPHILSAMEQQAVAFMDWRENQNCSQNQETGLWYIFGIDDQCFTTKELYTLFNNPTNERYE